MKTLTLAVVVLASLSAIGQQLKSTGKNDTAPRKPDKASSGVVLSENKTPPHEYTTTADGKKHDAAGKTKHAPPAPARVERLRNWFQSFKEPEQIAIIGVTVTTFYFLATVMIWFSMLRANKQAKRAYKESKRAADADRALMREQLEAYERPWVSASIVIKDGLYFSADGSAVAYFNPVLKNVGKSVANITRIAVELIVIPVGEDGVQYAREKVMAMTSSGPSAAFALFPGDTDSSRLRMPRLSKDTIAAGIVRDVDGGFESVRIAVISTVFYEFATSQVEHVTRSSFILSRCSPNGPSFFIRVGLDLMGNEVAPQMNSVHYAD